MIRLNETVELTTDDVRQCVEQLTQDEYTHLLIETARNHDLSALTVTMLCMYDQTHAGNEKLVQTLTDALTVHILARQSDEKYEGRTVAKTHLIEFLLSKIRTELESKLSKIS